MASSSLVAIVLYPLVPLKRKFARHTKEIWDASTYRTCRAAMNFRLTPCPPLDNYLVA